MSNRYKDISDQRFGKLVAVEATSRSKDRSKLWVCKCDCGKTVEVTQKMLKAGDKKHCGKCKQVRKDLIKDISGKEFGYLTAIEVTVERDYIGTYIYNGLNRVDNSRGYETDNVVPCCGRCNRAKDVHSKEDFIFWVKNIYNNLQDKGYIKE